MRILSTRLAKESTWRETHLHEIILVLDRITTGQVYGIGVFSKFIGHDVRFSCFIWESFYGNGEIMVCVSGFDGGFVSLKDFVIEEQASTYGSSQHTGITDIFSHRPTEKVETRSLTV